MRRRSGHQRTRARGRRPGDSTAAVSVAHRTWRPTPGEHRKGRFRWRDFCPDV